MPTAGCREVAFLTSRRHEKIVGAPLRRTLIPINKACRAGIYVDRASVPNCGVWNWSRGFKVEREGLGTTCLAAARSRSLTNLPVSLSLLILHYLSSLDVAGQQKKRLIYTKNCGTQVSSHVIRLRGHPHPRTRPSYFLRWRHPLDDLTTQTFDSSDF